MAADSQPAIKATIRRASKKARRELRRIDRDMQVALQQTYAEASDQLRADIEAAADGGGTVPVEVLQRLLDQVNGRLDQLSQARGDLLEAGMQQAAVAGVAPFAPLVEATALASVSHDAVQFVQRLIAEDGLQLSDRIWRVDRQARDEVASAVQQAVIQGKSASDAAQDFLAQGQPVPGDLAAKMRTADSGRVAKQSAQALMTGDGNPMANAMRLFRTEINRAHGEAYQAAAFETDAVIGTKFLLSPNHRRRDICDMHASVNRYGLGAGIYPKDRNPWPAHPNTISFVVAVFADEVTADDRNGKQTRVEWIKQQPSATRAAVLGGLKKRAAFDAGHISENAIATPWKTIKKRLKRKGVNVDAFSPAKA